MKTKNLFYDNPDYGGLTVSKAQPLKAEDMIQQMKKIMVGFKKQVVCIEIICQVRTYQAIRQHCEETTPAVQRMEVPLGGSLFNRLTGISIRCAYELPESILYILRFSNRTMDIHYRSGFVKKGLPDYDDPNVHNDPQNPLPLWEYLRRQGLLHREGDGKVPGEVRGGPGGEEVPGTLSS